MEIAELKRRLGIVAVADHLGIKVGKHLKAVCPFHDDGKSSLQFSKEMQTYNALAKKLCLPSKKLSKIFSNFFSYGDRRA